MRSSAGSLKVRPNPGDITKRLGPEFGRWFRGLSSLDRGLFLIMTAFRCHERHAETLTEYCDTFRETRVDFIAGRDVPAVASAADGCYRVKWNRADD